MTRQPKRWAVSLRLAAKPKRSRKKGQRIALYDADRALIGYARLLSDQYVSLVRWGDRTFHRVSSGADPERYHEIRASLVLTVVHPDLKDQV